MDAAKGDFTAEPHRQAPLIGRNPNRRLVQALGITVLRQVLNPRHDSVRFDFPRSKLYGFFFLATRIYRSFRWGKNVELFILDTRQYRNFKKGTMLGDAQKEWLFDGIGKSSALFKFIATSVTMAGGDSDRWEGFPKERQTILRYINEKKIRGVVFLSADMHYAAITNIPKSGGIKDRKSV